MTRMTLLLVGAALIGTVAAMAADSPVGQWNTVDEKSGKVRSTVEVYDQGGKIFARITGLTDSNDDQGKPRTCIACKGDDKNKPIVGLVIGKDLSASGDRYRGGTTLDPRTARSTRRRSGSRTASSRCEVTLGCSIGPRRGSKRTERLGRRS